MSTLTSLARVWAAERGCAQPLTTIRHTHVSHRPLVLVPLTMAGEANAPLAAMIGDDRGLPRIHLVAQPRRRSQRFAFAADLAGDLLEYIASFEAHVVQVGGNGQREARPRCVDAPQIWVPNGAGIKYLGLLGRLTRFRDTVGEYAVQPSVPRLGKWATFFADQANYADSSLLLAATHVLTAHWATGQSAAEDGNLAAVLAWIDTPGGQSALHAALRAEDPVAFPPAGPATDPSFDKEVLAPALTAYDLAGSENSRQWALSKLRKVLVEQMQPTWDAVWRSIDLLNAVPPAVSVAERWEQDRAAFTTQSLYLAGDGRPQPKHDNAVAAARRLNEMERRLATYDAQRAIDDPLVMAEQRLAGEAFTGIVVDAEPDRVTRSGASGRRQLRPLITVDTADPVRLNLDPKAFSDNSRPLQRATMRSVAEVGDRLRVRLELVKGMGNGLTPQPGTVPAVGQSVCYSTLQAGYSMRPRFPAKESTPWTHGGPPEPPQPAPGDQAEVWS